MAAYNWITICYTCLACRREASIRCQTHIASSYDGDETGRFFDRDYRLGERMAWWVPGHKNYPEWREEEGLPISSNDAVEACYSRCESCDAGLCVVLRFDDLTPSEVLSCGLEEHWPEGYRR